MLSVSISASNVAGNAGCVSSFCFYIPGRGHGRRNKSSRLARSMARSVPPPGALRRQAARKTPSEPSLKKRERCTSCLEQSPPPSLCAYTRPNPFGRLPRPTATTSRRLRVIHRDGRSMKRCAWTRKETVSPSRQVRTTRAPQGSFNPDRLIDRGGR
jgi:hypothetical protein